MKKLLLITAILIFPLAMAFAQPNPGQNAGGTPAGGTGGGAPIGGGAAPVGSGIALLLALGAGYGAKKIYDVRKKLAE
ncbi:MAG: hypothetical protein Q7J34_14255 [Bacteroidales bacterium]|jgi:hypothetical protein|nr:hypothetical protein [Bacteroidales bacterium]